MSSTLLQCRAEFSLTGRIFAAVAEVNQFLLNCLPLLFPASTAAVRVIAAGQVIDSVAGS